MIKINHLTNSKINFDAYDKCITQSSQSRIHALSWFLNIISPGWELLMADDYNYVMPIPPAKRKFLFFKNAIQSSGCHQLGIFSTKKLDEQIFNSFIKAIPAKYYSLKFNPHNVFPHPKIGVCTNLTLNLSLPYKEIRSKYRKERIRHLEGIQDITFEKSNDVGPYWNFIYQNCNSSRDSHNRDKFRLIFEEMSKKKLLEVWAAKNSNDELQAVACFAKWNKRIYYFFPASIHLQFLSSLLDKFIQENSKNKLELDFVASSSPVSARFIESFGAAFEPYPSLTKK